MHQTRTMFSIFELPSVCGCDWRDQKVSLEHHKLAEESTEPASREGDKGAPWRHFQHHSEGYDERALAECPKWGVKGKISSDPGNICLGCKLA